MGASLSGSPVSPASVELRGRNFRNRAYAGYRSCTGLAGDGTTSTRTCPAAPCSDMSRSCRHAGRYGWIRPMRLCHGSIGFTAPSSSLGRYIRRFLAAPALGTSMSSAVIGRVKARACEKRRLAVVYCSILMTVGKWHMNSYASLHKVGAVQCQVEAANLHRRVIS